MEIGGKEKQFELLVKSLPSYDIEYKILLRKKKLSNKFKNISSNIRYSNHSNLFSFVYFIRRHIKEFNPDIIHTWEGFVTLCANISRILYSTKLIDGEIRFAQNQKVLSKLWTFVKINSFFSDIVIANSQMGLKTFHFNPSKKFRVIYNGINLSCYEDFPGSGISSDQITIGTVANFTSPKDFITIINCGIELLNEGLRLRFIFIGDGPERKKMEKIIPEVYRDYFNFLGAISDVNKHIAKFDICVLLSKQHWAEGISNSIMEYMAMGKPVIATNTGGNPELIVEGETGFLIPHEDIKALKIKLILLINSADLRREMGEKGRRHLENTFGLHRMIDQYINLYKELAT